MSGIRERGPAEQRSFPLRLVLASLLFGILLGCKTGEDEGFQVRGRSWDQPIRVEVDNNNFLDITVYAMDNGANIRLGNVVGKSSDRFTIDSRRIAGTGGLRLLVDPIGANDAFLSDRVMVSPGGTVLLQVGAVLSQSFISLR